MTNNNSFIDHYSVLGLPSGEEGAELTAKDIETAYRRQAVKVHPDKNRDDPMATVKFQHVVMSAAVLRDGNSRRAFDALLALRMAMNVKQSAMNEKDGKKGEKSGGTEHNSVVEKEDRKGDSVGVRQSTVNKYAEEKAEPGGGQQTTVNENYKSKTEQSNVNEDDKKKKQSRNGTATTARARSRRQNNGKYYNIFRKAQDMKYGYRRHYYGESFRAAQRTFCPNYSDFHSSWEERRENMHSYSSNYTQYPGFHFTNSEIHGHPHPNNKGKGKAGQSSSGGIDKGKGKGKAGVCSNGGDAKRKRDSAHLDAKIEALEKIMKTASEALKKAEDEIRDSKRCKFYDERRRSGSS